MRRVSGGDSAHSQMDSIQHFGLTDADTVDLLEVEWPTGTVQSFTNVEADDLIRIDGTIHAGWPVRARSAGAGPLRYSAQSGRFSARGTNVSQRPATSWSARGAAPR